MIRILAAEVLVKENRTRHIKAGLSSLALYLEAGLVAGCGTALWCLIWTQGCHFAVDSEVRVTAVILLLGGVFAIAAAITCTETVRKSMQMSEAVLRNDEETFLVLRDMHIPRRMHLILGTYGGVSLLLISLLGFASAFEGAVVVFGCYLAFTVYFSATLELQDPLQSAWFRKHTPPGWLTCDVHERLPELRKEKQQSLSPVSAPAAS